MSFPGYTRPRDHGERLAQLDQPLAGWRDYIQKAPEDGNSLAGDDHLFPMLPPSQLAWFGIVSAVDHLDMFMALVRSGTSRPLAHNTVARTGGAQRRSRSMAARRARPSRAPEARAMPGSRGIFP